VLSVFLFLIRPRRFGKSLLQSVMECYYDREWAKDFDELFAETWIADHPTVERGAYLTLRFDFSMVSRVMPGGLAASFDSHLRIRLGSFLKRHAAVIPAEEAAAINAEPDSYQRLQRLFAVLAEQQLALYLFIDEYDHFANNILVEDAEAAYRALTHGGGFSRASSPCSRGRPGRPAAGWRGCSSPASRP
jgi:hypothetical protein